jgi:glycosyltransferase involved in cell wall biosynthesis
MKICNIIYSYYPYNCGGADIYAENISKYLAKEGHESIVITTKPYINMNSLIPSIEYIENVKVYKFYPLNIYFIKNNVEKNLFHKAIWSLIDTYNPHPYTIIKKILIEEKPDVVHLHTPISLSLSIYNLIKKLKIPLIFTIHEYFLICKRSFLFRNNGENCKNPNIFCKIYRNFSKIVVDSKPDVVISPSNYSLNVLVKHGFFRDSKKVVLPNGINVPLKPVHKIKNNYVDILYIGAIVKHKGIHLLVKAFNQIKDEKLRLHIAGNGPLLENLKKFANKDNRIKFYGWISEVEKDRLLRLADISVLPSIWYENFPVFIQEAFCYSTPVIGSRIGGIPELVIDGYNGFLCEAGDIESLKRIIREFSLLKKGNIREIIKNVFISVKEYDMEKHVEKLIRVYKDSIKK